MVEELEILQDGDTLKTKAKNYYLKSTNERGKDIFQGTEILLDENSDRLYLYYKEQTKMTFLPICKLDQLEEEK